MHASVSVLKRDRRFAPLIRKHGVPDFNRPHMRRTDVFQSLCRAIVYQQLSGKAAATILVRFIGLFQAERSNVRPTRSNITFPTPNDVWKMSVHKMRAAGLSMQKVSYLKDLAEKFSDGTIRHRSLGRMQSADIVEHLTQVKGVGVWTVHMFLIFTLNRPDVLPTGDLGIRKGFQMLYKLKDLPDHKTMEKLALPWREHASAAAWYLWRAADEAKTKD